MREFMWFMICFDALAALLFAVLLIAYRFENRSGIEVSKDPTDKCSPYYLDDRNGAA